MSPTTKQLVATGFRAQPSTLSPRPEYRAHDKAGVLAGLTAAACLLVLPAAIARAQGATSTTLDTHDATPLTVPKALNLPNDFSKIVQQVGPAVVNINTQILPHAEQPGTRKGRQQPMQPDGGADAPDSENNMQQFFQRFFNGQGHEAQPQEERGLGSGFIVDPRGYIVTNNHVIDKADRIYVKLTTDPATDQGHRATVVGVDKETDLAVIHIDVGHPLPTVKLGNSDGAQVGDWVEAIGSPFDLSQTVTAGIISARNRDVEGGVGGQFKHYIQTDAAINPGNSGGPLLNMEGQVVGVNTAFFTQSNGYMGIGFAMPSNVVIDVYNQLISPEHKVVRGSLGISFQPQLNSTVARMYHASAGVLISEVTPGQAAARAGLKPDDVVVSIDGVPVRDGADLVNNISARHPGSVVTLGYLRNGQTLSARCTLGDRAAISNVAEAEPHPQPEEARPGAAKTRLGIAVSDLPENAPAGAHGVVVQAVTPGSFADELDPQIGAGVLIESINRTPVKDSAQFQSLVAALKPGDDVALEIASPNRPSQSVLTGGILP
ncbi:trypsin-like peptidase domain-containing protein [Acidipila sp. EB88]|uniref:trypsin-like peptidase domain-containing protein n=1 Tax=Acidipila sp. EB88 TaxID=2305226 RepID=UPI000F5E02ED|nr:trypsin-like peptidase domain-containing protein [Acidipila sp. EB88]RRA47964.1 PDZ domain-containing protein [Acidipila sp. EB88]